MFLLRRKNKSKRTTVRITCCLTVLSLEVSSNYYHFVDITSFLGLALEMKSKALKASEKKFKLRVNAVLVQEKCSLCFVFVLSTPLRRNRSKKGKNITSVRVSCSFLVSSTTCRMRSQKLRMQLLL